MPRMIDDAPAGRFPIGAPPRRRVRPAGRGAALVALALIAAACTASGGATDTAIDAAHTARAADLTLDAASAWTVTADSHLTSLTDTAGISGTTITNILGNGHTVTYDATAAASSALGGLTYALVGGGTLTPA